MKTIELLNLIRSNIEQNQNLGGVSPVILNEQNPIKKPNGLIQINENSKELSFAVMDKTESGHLRKRFLVTIKDTLSDGNN